TQFLVRSGKQMIGLVSCVTLLCCDPSCQRFSVIVINRSSQRLNIAVDDDTMPMTLSLVEGLLSAIEDGAGRIKRSAQPPAVDSINETSAVSRDLIRRDERLQFAD